MNPWFVTLYFDDDKQRFVRYFAARKVLRKRNAIKAAFNSASDAVISTSPLFPQFLKEQRRFLSPFASVRVLIAHLNWTQLPVTDSCSGPINLEEGFFSVPGKAEISHKPEKNGHAAAPLVLE